MRSAGLCGSLLLNTVASALGVYRTAQRADSVANLDVLGGSRHLGLEHLERDLSEAPDAVDLATGDQLVHAASDADPNGSATDYLKKLWGNAAWPASGQEKRPTEPGASAPWSTRILGIVLIALALALAASSRIQVHPPREWKFARHCHALASAIVWRHLHFRAMLLHVARVAIPALLLVLLYKMRGFLKEQLAKGDAEELIKLIGAGSSDGVVEAIVETALATSFVYVVMLSMVFFVWHVGAESESGFRHLLHVSGLSRPAYILVTAGIEGIVLALLGVLVMVLVAGGLLSVRMVLWSSPLLIFVCISLMSAASIVTGYLLHFACPSARLASIVSQVVLLMVVFTAPFAPVSDVVPPPGGQTWRMMFLPTIPAYRATFELVAGCVKGRCLGLDDLAGALSGNWVGPLRILAGGSGTPEMTPPEAMLSFVFLVTLQLVVGWTLVVLLDRYFHPALHDSGAHSSTQSLDQGTVLEVSGLVHWYGWLNGVGAAPTNKVLNGVSFSLARGSMLGMLGPNGAGKTTAIRCITGEERPIEGKVAISAHGADGSIQTNIGLCPQETVVNGDLTVAENLLFFARLRGAYGEEGQAEVESSLQATRLAEKRDDLPSTLSGGMRRRLAVGCAMIAKPAVAILDEPTTGLDPMSRRSLWESINSIRSGGGCCLLTTHMLEEAEALCSSLIILSKGRVVAEGSVQQLKQLWGTGYMLSVDCKPGQEEEAKGFMKTLLAEEDQVPVTSKTGGQLTFKFTRDEEALGNAIIRMARGREGHGIRHWGVSQASLEDAYVRIIQESAPDAEAAALTA